MNKRPTIKTEKDTKERERNEKQWRKEAETFRSGALTSAFASLNVCFVTRKSLADI